MTHTKSLIEKQGEYIKFLGEEINMNAGYLHIHGINTSPERIEKGKRLRAEISALQEQEDKELPIDKSYVAMNKVNEICDKAERDIELENKLIDFANWYLRLIKVTTDKDERHDIENREIVWSFLRGDDYKLWWNKFGESVDQSGIREELIKFCVHINFKGGRKSIQPKEIDEYLKSNQ